MADRETVLSTIATLKGCVTKAEEKLKTDPNNRDKLAALHQAQRDLAVYSSEYRKLLR